MDMNDEKTYMENGKTTATKKKRVSKIVIYNSSANDAKLSLEEMVKRYLLKKALEIKDDIA